ncbi:hypothetical protein LTR10_009098 [Elasticomyces elasticus]|nr:hypothetical protein LTR10_009098 [Elasticomyces elasticus]
MASNPGDSCGRDNIDNKDNVVTVNRSTTSSVKRNMVSSLYEPLLTPTSIRVLRLRQIQWVDEEEMPIECGLEVIDLDDATHKDYYALSYTWGNPQWCADEGDQSEYPKAEHTISCDGEKVGVRKNLFDALRRIRRFSDVDTWWGKLYGQQVRRQEHTLIVLQYVSPYQLLRLILYGTTHLAVYVHSPIRKQRAPGYVLIDALCINQEDTAERSAQVSFMGEIFARSKAVAKWLGTSDEHSLIALPLVERIGKAIWDREDNDHGIPDPHGHGVGVPFNDKATFEAIGVPRPSDAEWLSICHLMTRSWFQRTWTLLEDCLGRASLYVCGSQVCAGRDLSVFCAFVYKAGWIRRLRQRLSKDIQGLGASYGFDTMPGTMGMRFWDPIGLQNLRLILELCFGIDIESADPRRSAAALAAWTAQVNRLRPSSDPQDRVFAALALASSFEAHLQSSPMPKTVPRPDYARHFIPVFADFTRYVFEQTLSLFHLCSTEPSTSLGPSRNTELPSWVKDYTTDSRGNGRHSQRHKGRRHVFRDCCPQQPLVLHPMRHPLLLEVDGYRLTNLEQTSSLRFEECDFVQLVRLAKDVGANAEDWFSDLIHTLTAATFMDDMASLQKLLPYTLSAEVLSGGFLTSHADADAALLSPVYPARLEELHSEAGACKICPSLSELMRGLEAIFRSMWSTEKDVDKYAGIDALLGSYRTTKERFCGKYAAYHGNTTLETRLLRC